MSGKTGVCKGLAVSGLCLTMAVAWCGAEPAPGGMVAGATQSATELAEPKTGGPGGGPVSILILGGIPTSITGPQLIDPGYQKELTAAGYRVVATPLTSKLTLDYLKQFGVVVLSGLPHFGQRFRPDGYKLANVDGNLTLIHDYVAAGGGLLFEPAFSEGGESYGETYNAFLKRYDVRFLVRQLCHDAETHGSYAAGMVIGGHAIAGDLRNVLYPAHVMRWDDAYSTTPFVAGKEWTLLASGKPGSGTHKAIDNSHAGPQQTTDNALLAVRISGKGCVAVSAIHAYYTLTHAFWNRVPGEDDTGLIDGITLSGEKKGRPSDYGKLLDRTYRFLAARSAANGIGGGSVELPPQPSLEVAGQSAIDWHTVVPPPTWRHRAFGAPAGGKTYWDEYPDMTVKGEMRYFKALIGPRSAYSSGRGTVAEYRQAALKAGYSAIIFCETFQDMDAQKWARLVTDCYANSDDSFVCLPGLDIADFQGGRYLMLCPNRFPDPAWLTPDGRQLKATRILSLGMFGHLSSVHRSGRSPLNPKMYKHYHGITVYTYDATGNLADDALYTYQWAVHSDSNPFPIAAHELTAPEQVAKAAATGFQQILPAPDLAVAVEYFRGAVNHYFECPARYFISEGPILDGWSIRNKDIGDAAELHRDHYRIGIGVSNNLAIADVTLYDGFDVARRWRPDTATFQTMVDGFHDAQHEYLVLATDARGRRVLSPGIRTVPHNWRLRCGDRQNWLGSMRIYTGTAMQQGFGKYSLPFRNTREGGSDWIGSGGGNPCTVLDFPYFANTVTIETADLTTKYVDTDMLSVGYDGRPVYAARSTDFTDGSVRLTRFTPKRPDFAVCQVEVSIRLKCTVEPAPVGKVWPVIASAMGTNQLLLISGQSPTTLPVAVKSAGAIPVELPVGSYVGGIVPLTQGLYLDGRSIGFRAPPPDMLTVPEDTTWTASYLVLKASPFAWNNMNAGYDVDVVAERAMSEMGFAGKPPFVFDLKQGRLERLACCAELTAANGGIAGVCRNETGKKMLVNVPLRIRGLNPRWPSAVWRADSATLDYFTCYEGEGRANFDADKTVEFYAGNVVSCDPSLIVEPIIWNANEAWFRINNPTTHAITTDFATTPCIKGFKVLQKTITVPAGASVELSP